MQNPKIVIVDDCIPVLNMTKESIQINLGFENIICFSNPMEAHAYLWETKSDILITESFFINYPFFNVNLLLDHALGNPNVIVSSSFLFVPPGHVMPHIKNEFAILFKPWHPIHIKTAINELITHKLQ